MRKLGLIFGLILIVISTPAFGARVYVPELGEHVNIMTLTDTGGNFPQVENGEIQTENSLDATGDSIMVFTRDTKGELQYLRSTPGGDLKVVSAIEDTFIVSVDNYRGETLPIAGNVRDEALNFVRSDSVTLSDTGDTAEINYSENVNKIVVWSYGGIVNYRADTQTATASDQAISAGKRTPLEDIAVKTLNIHNYPRNSGLIEVHISAWKYD